MNLAIFDIDGTLTNTNSVDEECFVKAFSEAQALTDIDTDWATYPHTTDSAITQHIFQKKLGRNPADTEVEKIKGCFVGRLTEQYLTNPSSLDEVVGASLVLEKLQRESDWVVAIASGCWRESALLKLKAARINAGKIPAAYAEDGLSREEILRVAVSLSLRHHRVDCFQKIVSIGDGLWDVRTAAILNFAFLGVDYEQSGRLQRAGTNHVIEDFSDYSQLLKLLIDAEVPDIKCQDRVIFQAVAAAQL